MIKKTVNLFLLAALFFAANAEASSPLQCPGSDAVTCEWGGTCTLRDEYKADWRLVLTGQPTGPYAASLDDVTLSSTNNNVAICRYIIKNGLGTTSPYMLYSNQGNYKPYTGNSNRWTIVNSGFAYCMSADPKECAMVA